MSNSAKRLNIYDRAHIKSEVIEAMSLFVGRDLTFGEIVAHELVHALENDLALGATHIQHAFVTQHAGAVNVDDGPQKIFQLGRIKGFIRAENKAFHIVIVVMVSFATRGAYGGFDWGFSKKFDVMVEMDADGSHRAADLPKLLAMAAKNDLVIGSRYVRGGKTLNWPFYRQWLSRGGNIYARVMLGSNINDMTAGFRAFRADFLKQLDLAGVNARGYSFQIEMAYRTLQA